MTRGLLSNTNFPLAAALPAVRNIQNKSETFLPSDGWNSNMPSVTLATAPLCFFCRFALSGRNAPYKKTRLLTVKRRAGSYGKSADWPILALHTELYDALMADRTSPKWRQTGSYRETLAELNKMKKTLCCLLLSAGLLANPAQANTFGLDLSDLWWNPNESGWGVTLNHQGDIVFVTLFVYGADGRATWFGGPNVPFTGNTAQGPSYSGPLYQLNGPPFGGAYDPTALTGRTVGNVTITATSATTAMLQYTVDGVPVSKAIERQTWRANALSGNYNGAESSTNSCLSSGPFPPENGPTTRFVISNTVNTFSMTTGNTTENCTYRGDYAQAGRLGRSAGTYTCTNGVNGTYVASEIEATSYSITGRVVIKVAACTFDNKFTALKN